MAQVDPALARHAEHAFPDLEHLFEAGDAVRAMVGTPGWLVVQKLLAAEIDAVSAPMDRARDVLDQAEYAQRHGRIGGLKAAQAAADAIVGEAERIRSEQQAKHEAGAESPAER